MKFDDFYKNNKNVAHESYYYKKPRIGLNNQVDPYEIPTTEKDVSNKSKLTLFTNVFCLILSLLLDIVYFNQSHLNNDKIKETLKDIDQSDVLMDNNQLDSFNKNNHDNILNTTDKECFNLKYNNNYYDTNINIINNVNKKEGKN